VCDPPLASVGPREPAYQICVELNNKARNETLVRKHQASGCMQVDLTSRLSSHSVPMLLVTPHTQLPVCVCATAVHGDEVVGQLVSLMARVEQHQLHPVAHQACKEGRERAQAASKAKDRTSLPHQAC
jgi:hypothetical protein